MKKLTSASLMWLLVSTIALAQDLEELADALRASEAHHKVHLTPAGNVVEFYNTILNHYFRTAEAAEVTAVLQGAAGPGWVRTNDDFLAYVPTTGLLSSSAQPVCRFYARGPNSHFYTISQAECAQVKLDSGWHFEGNSFYALPASAAGTCNTQDYAPVYRVYNNRFAFNDSNHRFTTSTVTYQQMIGQGWIGEGTVMCVPLPTTMNQQRTEQLIGGTWTISYRFGTSNYVDKLTFTGVYQSPSTLEIYAQGVNQYGNPALGQFVPSLNQWLILSAILSTSAYPADVYAGNLAGDSYTGCYYFLLSASSPLGSCNSFTGVRH